MHRIKTERQKRIPGLRLTKSSMVVDLNLLFLFNTKKSINHIVFFALIQVRSNS